MIEENQSASRSSLLVDILFGITIAALFSGLNHHVGAVKIQLSDIFAAATIFVVVLRGFATPRFSLPLAIVLFLYLLVYCVSAFTVSKVNGVKELLQIALVFSFLVTIFGYYRTHSAGRVLGISAALIAAVLMYNIAWHVSQGFYVGWKRLNEPKTIFTLLPLILILLFDRLGNQRRALFVVASVTAAAIIILSGERKAYVFATIALVVWMGVASLRYMAVGALVLPVLIAAMAFDNTGYLNRQFGSFSNVLTNRVELASDSELFDASRPGTFSDAQRAFTQRVAKSMWAKRPIFGIGTGGYSYAMKRQFSIPPQFRLGIHGEFYRALYENGIVGFSLYLAYWIAASAGLIYAWNKEAAAGGHNLNRIKLLCMIMVFIYCASEASKGLTLLSICALPFIFALRPRREMAQLQSIDQLGSMQNGTYRVT